MSTSVSHLRIGIVGAGNIGGPLARMWTAAGHTVKIANSRGPETLTEVAQRTGATAATVEEAVKDTNVVVVSIPFHKVAELDKALFSGLPADTIVIDTGNYYVYKDGNIDELVSNTLTESRWIEEHLGHPVIKAFNNIYSQSLAELGQPSGTPHRIALPIAGDNATHKATVAALIDQIGFDAVDYGSLDDSWRQEPGAPVYCPDYDVDGVKRALSKADRGTKHAMRDLQLQGMMAAFANNTPISVPVFARQFMVEHYDM